MKKNYVPQRYKVRQIGDDVLRLRADNVDEHDFGSEKLQKDVKRLFVANRMAKGLGICAPQVGDSRRIFVWDSSDLGKGHIINPHIVWRGDRGISEEGCLSIPGYYFKVPRNFKLTIKGRNWDGTTIWHDAGGLFSFLLQHETDHLNGVLVTDRIDESEWLRFKQIWAKTTGRSCPENWRQPVAN